MGSHKLVELVFYVSLIVVILLAISFTILFTLYAIYKRRHIRYGHEDEKILGELKKKYSYSFETNHGLLTKNLPVESDKPDWQMVTCIEKSKRKSKAGLIIGKVISVIFFVLVLGLGGLVITYKVNHESFFFGNTTYMVVQTSSMETANATNTYLKENNLNDQIIQFSMIGIEKVESKDIRKYDILAFRNTDGDVIIHRVINITNENNEYRFTMRGDANIGSNTWETSVKEDAIIGKYNGFQNYGLGVATTYFKSSAGIVALVSAFVFLVAADVSDDRIDKEYEKRKLIVAQSFDVSGK